MGRIMEGSLASSCDIGADLHALDVHKPADLLTTSITYDSVGRDK